jgi:probable rRNA maturation factor
MTYLIDVQVDPSFAARVDPEQVRQVARETLLQEEVRSCASQCLHGSAAGVEETGDGLELTVLVTGDERVRELDLRYRGVDSPTDVLSFGGEAEGFVDAPGAMVYLGDVVISYPRVMAQATAQGWSPDKELALLVVHGVLHLAGYDHATPEEEAIMWARQEAILTRLGGDQRAAPEPTAG